MDAQEQAFPCPHYPGVHGMSLRDYFAAKAMAAMIAEPIPAGRKNLPVCNHLAGDLMDASGHESSKVALYLAHAAYVMADAMLAERAL